MTKARRCGDGTCNTCQSCQAKAQWADGSFARGLARRADRWLPWEDQFVRDFAGKLTPRQMAEEMRRLGYDRTVRAIHNRASTTLNLYLAPEAWSISRVAQLFGTTDSTISKAWIKTGLLPARQLPPRTGSKHGDWRIEEHDLEILIRTIPWAYDPALMQPSTHRLVQLARDLARRDPWVTAPEARRRLDLSARSWLRWASIGVIPDRRRAVGTHGGYGGTRVVRVADLPELARVIAASRRRAEQINSRRAA